jgi:hypothetical protein
MGDYGYTEGPYITFLILILLILGLNGFYGYEK